MHKIVLNTARKNRPHHCELRFNVVNMGMKTVTGSMVKLLCGASPRERTCWPRISQGACHGFF